MSEIKSRLEKHFYSMQITQISKFVQTFTQFPANAIVRMHTLTKQYIVTFAYVKKI